MKRLLLFTLVLALSAACSSRPGETSFPSELDSMKRNWNRLNESGNYRELIRTTRPYHDAALARSDTSAVLYSAATLAQAYLFLDQPDSVRLYLDRTAWFEEEIRDPALGTVINNVLGILALKDELDYPKALECFRKGLEWAEKGGDTNNRIAFLINIVNIYYIRSDYHGIEYAEKALNLTESSRANPYHKALAALSMGQMLLLKDEPAAARRYAGEASGIIEQHNIRSLKPALHLLLASCDELSGRSGNAEIHFRASRNYLTDGDPTIASLACLQYGKFCETAHRYEQADSLYREGLGISYANRNVLFRQELLRSLSDLCIRSGNRDSAWVYFNRYRILADSIASIRQEQEFNNRVLAYQQMEYEHELQSKELDLLKAERNTYVIIFVSVIVLTLSISAAVLYKKQRNMLRTLVSQHQQYLSRRNSEALLEFPPAENPEPEDNAPKGQNGRELYLRCEELMRTQKVYRRKDISIEKTAEMLATNRTYLSKAINTFAGLSFHNYINSYRIGEATAIISDLDNDIPMKMLASELGYNSESVFYKAFQRETGCTPSRYRREIAARKETAGRAESEDSSN